MARTIEQGGHQACLRQQDDARAAVTMMVMMTIGQTVRPILILDLRPVMLGIMGFFGSQSAEQHMRVALRRARFMLDAVHRARQAHPGEQHNQQDAKHRTQT